jgi:DNA repair protein RadC
MKNNIAEVHINYIPKQFTSRVKINGSIDAYEVFKSLWSDQIHYREQMYVLLLNRANRVLGFNELGLGGTTGVVADIKVILALAIKTNSHSIILAHNHPSGNTKASQQDLDLTNKLKQAAKWMDIEVLDHLIVTGEDTYLSMADEGIL